MNPVTVFALVVVAGGALIGAYASVYALMAWEDSDYRKSRSR